MAEALSPRAVNRQSNQPPVSKTNSGNKEKNHASPPPSIVAEPSGDLNVKYETGRLLGKGGFAVCYEGTVIGLKYGKNLPKFALKIVKANMGMKKMEEKVNPTELKAKSTLKLISMVVPDRIANTLEDATPKYR